MKRDLFVLRNQTLRVPAVAPDLDRLRNNLPQTQPYPQSQRDNGGVDEGLQEAFNACKSIRKS